MFIRLKRVRLARKSGYQDEYSLHAVLVENHRVNGKPRQHIISYLGSIREKFIGDASRRNEFLTFLNMKLRKLDLTPRDLSKVLVKLISALTHNRIARR